MFERSSDKGLLDAKRSVILVFTVVLILGGFSGVLVSRAAWASTGTAIVWTDQSDYPVGATATIYGTGFLPSALVNMTVLNPDNSTVSWQLYSNSTGGFVTQYLLSVPGLLYNVTATDGTNTAATTFMDVALSVSPGSGPVGTSVTASITGNGGGSGSGSIYWDGSSLSPAVPIVCKNGDGSFAVPAGASVGAHTVSANGCGGVPTATFEVTQIVLTPSSGPVGTTVSVSGTGFTQDSTKKIVGLTINGATPATTTCLSSPGDQLSASGSFACTFTVPPLSLGSYAVVATDNGVATCGGHCTGSASFTVTPATQPLTVSKTATATFTRTYTWGISKSVDNSQRDIAQGGTAPFTYTVSVTHNSGTDSAWEVTGMITVTNPNSFAVTGVAVTDTIDHSGSCSVTGGSSTTIPASSSSTFSYTCAFASNPGSGTNTATATWSAQGALAAGSASGTAAYSFGAPISIRDGSVTVVDSLGGSLGTVSHTDLSPRTFTYSHTFSGDPAGTCTSHGNTATFTTDTSGTTGSASQTVKVCVGENLTVSKTATSTFTRTFAWGISKSVDNTLIKTAGGSPAVFNYVVSVSHDPGTDSAWAVGGTITVTNPNDWESITFTLADVVDNGGVCTIGGGSGPYSVAASSSTTFTYACTFSSGASGTNTAAATWDAVLFSTPDGSASGSASFALITPTTIVDGSVTVADALGGSLGTVSYTDPSPTTFTYSKTFTDPAGTCTSHANTATFTTNTSGTTGSASQTVTDCQGADLIVSKTASSSFTRTFTWGITKSASPTTAYSAGGGTSGSVTYAVKVTHDSGTDTNWQVTGTITVTNPNDWEAITATVTDGVADGGSCTVTGGSSVSVPASGSVTLAYACTYASQPSDFGTNQANTATATWDGTAASTPDSSASGSALYTFNGGSAGNPTVVDGSVTVTDTLGGILGTVSYTDPSPTTFTYSKAFTDPAGTCTSHSNSATFTTDTTGSTGSASQTVTDCQGADVTVSKDANPTFTRTFRWGITKVVDVSLFKIAQGGSATPNYMVGVTHDSGTDSVWQVIGTITVINPNDWESITVNLADAVDNGGSCVVTPGTVTVPASSTASASYTCTWSSAPTPLSGTNTATATWDASASHTLDGSASGSASFVFTTPTTIVDGSVAVVDSLIGTLGTVLYTDPSPNIFPYSTTFSIDPAGTCTSHDNTATLTTSTTGATGSASQSVQVCVGADLTVSKTATPTFTRTYAWSISKTVSPTSQTLTYPASATLSYTVTTSETGFADSLWAITGTITVTNPNNWESITFNLADAVNNGGSCSVTGGSGPYTVAAGSSASYTYSCTFASGASGTNTATATWSASTYFTPHDTASGTAGFAFTTPTTRVYQSVTVTDAFNGGSATTFGTLTATDSTPYTTGTYSYSHTVSGTRGTCTTYSNTATISETSQIASQSAQVCVSIPTTLAYKSDTKGEYSDPITLKALLTDDQGNAIQGETITFVLGSQTATATTDSNGMALTTLVLNQPKGFYTVTASFAGDTAGPVLYAGSTASSPFTIIPEPATVAYTGTTSLVTVNTCTITLSAQVASELDDAPGDITLAKVTFLITDTLNNQVGTAGPYAVSQTSPGVGIVSTSATGSSPYGIQCATENTYLVYAKLDPSVNNYYAGPDALNTLVVYTPSGQFLTLGGWIVDPNTGSHGNFGGVVRIGNRGVSGSFVYIFRGACPTGYSSTSGLCDYMFKSTSWQGSTLGFSQTSPAGACPTVNNQQLYCYATFQTQHGVMQILDAVTGKLLYSQGNIQITVGAWDNTNTGRNAGIDQFTMSVTIPAPLPAGSATTTLTTDQVGSVTKPISLSGGNIVVHWK